MQRIRFVYSLVVLFIILCCNGEESTDKRENAEENTCMQISDAKILSDLSRFEKLLFFSNKPTVMDFDNLTGGDAEYEIRFCRCQRYYGKPCNPTMKNDYVDSCGRKVEKDEVSFYYKLLRESIFNKGKNFDFSHKKIKKIFRPAEYMKNATMPVFIDVEYGGFSIRYFHKGRKCDPHPNIDVFEINGVDVNIENGEIFF